MLNPSTSVASTRPASLNLESVQKVLSLCIKLLICNQTAGVKITEPSYLLEDIVRTQYRVVRLRIHSMAMLLR